MSVFLFTSTAFPVSGKSTKKKIGKSCVLGHAAPDMRHYKTVLNKKKYTQKKDNAYSPPQNHHAGQNEKRQNLSKQQW